MTTEVGEIFLDYLTFVAGGDDKILETVRTIITHDMPEDRFVADLHHWFWDQRGFLAQSRSQATG